MITSNTPKFHKNGVASGIRIGLHGALNLTNSRIKVDGRKLRSNGYNFIETLKAALVQVPEYILYSSSNCTPPGRNLCYPTHWWCNGFNF